MNVVRHSSHLNLHASHPFDNTSDILVEVCEIIVQNIGCLGLGMENDM